MVNMMMSMMMNKTVKKAKELLSGIEILEIDLRKAIRFGKNQNKNDEKFVKWIVWLLDKYNTNDATSLRANEEINNYLHAYLTPMTWLNYSPVTDNSLESNEIGVKLNGNK